MTLTSFFWFFKIQAVDIYKLFSNYQAQVNAGLGITLQKEEIWCREIIQPASWELVELSGF